MHGLHQCCCRHHLLPQGRSEWRLHTCMESCEGASVESTSAMGRLLSVKGAGLQVMGMDSDLWITMWILGLGKALCTLYRECAVLILTVIIVVVSQILLNICSSSSCVFMTKVSCSCMFLNVLMSLKYSNMYSYKLHLFYQPFIEDCTDFLNHNLCWKEKTYIFTHNTITCVRFVKLRVMVCESLDKYIWLLC